MLTSKQYIAVFNVTSKLLGFLYILLISVGNVDIFKLKFLHVAFLKGHNTDLTCESQLARHGRTILSLKIAA